MRLLVSILTAALLLGSSVALGADGTSFDFGGDHYGAGSSVSVSEPVKNDVFLAGQDVTVAGPVGGDAHLAGYAVRSAGSVQGNVYAMGFTVDVSGTVGGDITAAGNSVTLSASTPVGGNVRLGGQNVTINSPVTGSALVAAQTLTLNAAVAGDLTLVTENVSFGTDARVDGKLTVKSSKDITVPASVATADRVSIEKLPEPEHVAQASQTAQNVTGSFWPALWGPAFIGLVLFIVGIIFIALMPRGMAVLREVSVHRPWRTLGVGILAFASVLGLLPVVAMTIVGLVLVPLALLYIVVAWALAYLCGTYFLGARIASAFFPAETNIARAGVLLLSLIVAGLLGMIPVLGWIIGLLIVTFGFGTIALAIFRPRQPVLPAPTATAAA